MIDLVDKERAWLFAQSWVEAWNGHDLDLILAHYSPEVIFQSPFAQELLGDGCVVGIDSLRAYWRRGLDRQPNLHFEVIDVLLGYGSLTILYDNHRGQKVAETLVFGEDGLVTRAFACYSDGK